LKLVTNGLVSYHKEALNFAFGNFGLSFGFSFSFGRRCS